MPFVGRRRDRPLPHFRYVVVIPMFRRNLDVQGAVSITDVGTSYVGMPEQQIAIHFTEQRVKRIGIIASVSGNEAGVKGIRIFNYTDNAEIATGSWSGTAISPVSAFATLALTGLKWISVQWRGSSATEDLTLYSMFLVLHCDVPYPD